MAELQGLPIQDDSDATVLADVRAGNSAAFAMLVTRYRIQFGRYAVRMLGSREDAEEAMQDAFVRAFRSLETCEDPSKFGSWFFRILANRCRTAGARKGRRDRTFVRDDIALSSASEDHPAEQEAWREEIARALRLLDEDQREAFLLKHVEDMGYEEMSQLTGVGVSALKMRVKRACERLRAILQEAQGV